MSAFRMKMRNDAVAARAITDPETYEQQNKLGLEIATFLRKNVVQGVKVSNAENGGKNYDTFSMSFSVLIVTTLSQAQERLADNNAYRIREQ
jgi:hypothetical protein